MNTQTFNEHEAHPAGRDGDTTPTQSTWAELARARHAQLRTARAGRILESARHAAAARDLRERTGS